MSNTSPRVPPIELDQLTDEQACVLGNRNDPRCELNLFKTLVQHPRLLKSYSSLAMQLGADPTIPKRDKEFLILRTLFLCGETYESAHHLYIARQAGLSDQEIESAKHGGTGLAPFEQALVQAAEELVREHCVSDETWAVLAERYTTQQLIETVFMVGCYTMGAMVNNSLGIQPEAAVEKTWKPDQKV